MSELVNVLTKAMLEIMKNRAKELIRDDIDDLKIESKAMERTIKSGEDFDIASGIESEKIKSIIADASDLVAEDGQVIEMLQEISIEIAQKAYEELSDETE